jgi:hypothetical protein
VLCIEKDKRPDKKLHSWKYELQLNDNRMQRLNTIAISHDGHFNPFKQFLDISFHIIIQSPSPLSKIPFSINFVFAFLVFPHYNLTYMTNLPVTAGLYYLWTTSLCSIFYSPFTSSCSGPNIVAKWLALLLHIQDVPKSNPDPETRCPDWGFSRFFSVPPGKYPDGAST